MFLPVGIEMRSGETTVAVVEDNRRVRAALVSLIEGETGMRCLGQYASGEDAVAVIPQQGPDVILMDIHLGRMSGIDCVRQLKTRGVSSPIIMLTAYEDSDLIFQALKAGAGGYLLKQSPPGSILAAIRDVRNGGAPMTSSIARKVIQSFHRDESETAATESLTRREREILSLIAKGYTDREVAEELAITFETVHAHVRNIYRKLEVRSRSEAVAKFVRG